MLCSFLQSVQILMSKKYQKLVGSLIKEFHSIVRWKFWECNIWLLIRVGYNTIKCSEIYTYTKIICSHAPKSSFLYVFLCLASSYCPALPLFNGKRSISFIWLEPIFLSTRSVFLFSHLHLVNLVSLPVTSLSC